VSSLLLGRVLQADLGGGVACAHSGLQEQQAGRQASTASEVRECMQQIIRGSSAACAQASGPSPSSLCQAVAVGTTKVPAVTAELWRG
jgi:hypothetical protein